MPRRDCVRRWRYTDRAVLDVRAGSLPSLDERRLSGRRPASLLMSLVSVRLVACSRDCDHNGLASRSVSRGYLLFLRSVLARLIDS